MWPQVDDGEASVGSIARHKQREFNQSQRERLRFLATPQSEFGSKVRLRQRVPAAPRLPLCERQHPLRSSRARAGDARNRFLACRAGTSVPHRESG
jgi:hypothetical protein